MLSLISFICILITQYLAIIIKQSYLLGQLIRKIRDFIYLYLFIPLLSLYVDLFDLCYFISA